MTTPVCTITTVSSETGSNGRSQICYYLLLYRYYVLLPLLLVTICAKSHAGWVLYCILLWGGRKQGRSGAGSNVK